jgi:hypothetical protein
MSNLKAKGFDFEGYNKKPKTLRIDQLNTKKELSKEELIEFNDLLASDELKKRHWLLKRINQKNIRQISGILMAYGILTDKNRLTLDRLQGGETDIVKIEQTFTNVNKLIAKIEELKTKPSIASPEGAGLTIRDRMGDITALPKNEEIVIPELKTGVLEVEPDQKDET